MKSVNRNCNDFIFRRCITCAFLFILQKKQLLVSFLHRNILRIGCCLSSEMRGWSGPPEREWLPLGKTFWFLLNCALAKHRALGPPCSPHLLRERRHPPAISCADSGGTQPLSTGANGRADWIRLVIWEDTLATRHLPRTSPGCLKKNLVLFG